MAREQILPSLLFALTPALSHRAREMLLSPLFTIPYRDNRGMSSLTPWERAGVRANTGRGRRCSHLFLQYCIGITRGMSSLAPWERAGVRANKWQIANMT